MFFLQQLLNDVRMNDVEMVFVASPKVLLMLWSEKHCGITE